MKKILTDWHFWVTALTVAVATLPKLTGYLPKSVEDILLVVLGGVILVINNYQTHQAYAEGAMGLVGSKYAK